MTTAFLPVTLPETTTPASRIMRERDEAQARVADLERRLADSIKSYNGVLRSSMQNLRELREAHEIELARRADGYAEGTARLRADVERLHDELRRERLARSDAERSRDHYKATHERAKEIAEAAVSARLQHAEQSVRSLSGECADLRNQLCEVLAGEAGKDCESCGGTGEVFDVEPVHVGGPTNAYYERKIAGDCEDCFDGRVAK